MGTRISATSSWPMAIDSDDFTRLQDGAPPPPKCAFLAPTVSALSGIIMITASFCMLNEDWQDPALEIVKGAAYTIAGSVSIALIHTTALGCLNGMKETFRESLNCRMIGEPKTILGNTLAAPFLMPATVIKLLTWPCRRT